MPDLGCRLGTLANTNIRAYLEGVNQLEKAWAHETQTVVGPWRIQPAGMQVL